MSHKKVVIKEFRIEDMPLSCTWIVVGPPSSGKCLGKDVPILKYDGSIVLSQNLSVGDVLVGDDLTKRVVTSLGHGLEEMYEVLNSPGSWAGIPIPTTSYTCNHSHIMTVAMPHTGEVVDLPLSELLEYTDSFYGVRILNPDSRDGIAPIKAYTQLKIRPIGVGEYYGCTLTGNGRFLLADGTMTHNTTLMENFAYHCKHKYPVARVFMGTEEGYKRMCRIFHPLYVSNYWSEAEETSHVLRQRTCEMENGRGYPGNYAINIIDDVSDDPKIYKTKLMQGLFKLGSQHWAQLLMIGMQYAIDLGPSVRKSVSYVALGREPEEGERKKLYDNFGGLAGSYARFCDLMDQITGDHTFLIFQKRSQSNNMEDCVFWYQTKVPVENWRFGCAEYRKHAEDRYDKNYVEQIIM